MQYILNEDEMKALTSRETKEDTENRKQEASIAFRLIVDEIGCWKERGRYGYCDDCPLSDLRTICTQYREYSK